MNLSEAVTKSIPEPCPSCRGSRYVLVLQSAELLAALDPIWRMTSGAGFIRLPCQRCEGEGSNLFSEYGDFSPPPCGEKY